MIRVECEQGSAEWRKARAGVVTASGFDKILTPKERKPSKQAGEYLSRIVAEILLGRPIEDDGGSLWTERGLEMEADAVTWYEAEKDVSTEVVGFCLRDDRRVGASPDRLVGSDGGLEMKCPMASTHVHYLLNPDVLVAEYRAQVQANLLVTGRAWWDTMSFNPEIPPVVVRVTPDVEWRAAFVPALGAFLGRVDEALAKVRALMYGDIDSEDVEVAARALFPQ